MIDWAQVANNNLHKHISCGHEKAFCVAEHAMIFISLFNIAWWIQIVKILYKGNIKTILVVFFHKPFFGCQ